MGLFNDDVAMTYLKLTERVHNSDTKIAAQLHHSGRAMASNDFGRLPIAPSAIKVESTGITPREMDESEILEFINIFSQAAKRAKEAGFDGIEYHGCHGDLIHSFLSPLTNRRKDKWGGNLENSMRFLMEIYEESREIVGDDYPVLIKCNAHDYIEGGITIDLGKRIAEKISAMGFDAIEITAGTHTETIFNMVRGDIPKNFSGIQSCVIRSNSVPPQFSFHYS